MKLAFGILLAVASLALILLFFASPQAPRHDSLHLPWQVTVHDAEHSEVFGIVLNETRLQQAVKRFGELEGMALYQRDQSGRMNLEAYFGKVAMGPLSARLIVNLAADANELAQLATQTRKRTTTEQGQQKWMLSVNQQAAQLQRVITSLTFIPDYKGMDEAYLLARFGEPAERRAVDEDSELWFYPEPGVRILVDNEGREVFEYTAPSQFLTLTGGQ